MEPRGTRILLLEQLARLESELNELKFYRSKYHKNDKESAVLSRQPRRLAAADKLLDISVAAGGAVC